MPSGNKQQVMINPNGSIQTTEARTTCMEDFGVAAMSQSDEVISDEVISDEVRNMLYCPFIKKCIVSIIIISSISFIPGWFILFNIFRANLDNMKEPLRLFMKILLPIVTGFVFLGISTLIIIINTILFKLITYWKYGNNTGFGERIVAMLCICITNVSITYVGSIVLYDWCQIRLLTVDDKYIISVIIVSSLLSGWCVQMIVTFIGYIVCVNKEHRLVINNKIYKKFFNTENEDNMVVVSAQISSKSTKCENQDVVGNEVDENKEHDLV